MSKRHLFDHFWSGGGAQKHFLDRDAIQGQVSSTPKCNDSKFKQKKIFFFLRRENDLRTDDAKN